MSNIKTILMPEMLEYHSKLLEAAFAYGGYHVVFLTNKDSLKINAIKYMNNDFFYPAVLIVGQLIAALNQGLYDSHEVAFMEPQTDGACRAGNYYYAIKNALKKAGYEHVPVLSLNVNGEIKQKEFSVNLKMIWAALAAVCYGDMLMHCLQQTLPYEINVGDSKTLYDKWEEKLITDIKSGKSLSKKSMYKMMQTIVMDFDEIKRNSITKKRIGITGELYIKYSYLGNHNVEKYLDSIDCCHSMVGFINYVLYVIDGESFKQQVQKGSSPLFEKAVQMLMGIVESRQNDMITILNNASNIENISSYNEIKAGVDKYISYGCVTGDGWLIAAEVIDLIKHGYQKILILHPFGCLVSHVCGRGIVKSIKEDFPDISIHTIEYDYDSSETLRENRIMLAIY